MNVEQSKASQLLPILFAKKLSLVPQEKPIEDLATDPSHINKRFNHQNSLRVTVTATYCVRNCSRCRRNHYGSGILVVTELLFYAEEAHAPVSSSSPCKSCLSRLRAL